MKITKRQLRRIIKEAQWGRFTDGAAPLDEPMRDSGPVPKDQLRKLADMFISDMGMTPDEVLQKPEFVEQGITDLAQLDESNMKITKRQLRSLVRKSLLSEWQQGMDPDPSGQEVTDQVGEYEDSFGFDRSTVAGIDKAYDAAIAAGPTGLAQWISEQTDSYLYHLVDGGIWSGLAKNYRFDPQEVADELCRLKPGAWKDYKDEICFRK